MSGIWWGLLGAGVGATCAVLGLRVETARRRREGESTTARTVLLGTPHGVEREAMKRAAAITLPAYVLVVAILAATEVDSAAAGVMMGVAGFMYGSASAIASRRLSR